MISFNCSSVALLYGNVRWSNSLIYKCFWLHAFNKSRGNGSNISKDQNTFWKRNHRFISFLTRFQKKTFKNLTMNNVFFSEILSFVFIFFLKPYVFLYASIAIQQQLSEYWEIVLWNANSTHMDQHYYYYMNKVGVNNSRQFSLWRFNLSHKG